MACSSSMDMAPGNIPRGCRDSVTRGAMGSGGFGVHGVVFLLVFLFVSAKYRVFWLFAEVFAGAFLK